MTRKVVSQAELVDMVNRRFREGDDLDGDCRDVEISGVYRLAEPDDSDCNWSPAMYHGSPECGAVFESVMAEFQREYNLLIE